MNIDTNEFNKNKENSDSSLLPPQVSDYLDYRRFLADFYNYKKAKTKRDLRPYNYQMFSAAADIKSPNYLKMIIEGRRNLSDDMILKFAKALALSKEQTEEFVHLVHFSQTSEPAERNMHLKKISEMRVVQKLRSGEIDQKTWNKVPNWAAWIIYAMVDMQGVKFDISSLKKLLRGKASEAEIETALNSLLSSGELVRNAETGEIKKAHHLMEDADDIPVALVRKLQTQLMYLGLESLYQDQPTEREFGTLTLCLTKDEFEEIKFKLRQMRKSIHKDNSIARSKSKGDKVYQMNIQLFPVAEGKITSSPTQNSANEKTALVKNIEGESELLPLEQQNIKEALAEPQKMGISSLAAAALSSMSEFKEA